MNLMIFGKKRIVSYLICLLLAVSCTVFSLFSFASLPVSQTEKTLPVTTELRGVWLTNVASSVLFSPWGIDHAISELSKINFNTIYPVVWNRGHTFYKSPLAKSITGTDVNPWLNLMQGGQDVLSKIIQLAKTENITVIPWFEYGLMAPADSRLAKAYPDWLTTDNKGRKSIKDTPLEETNNNSPIQQVWLNPLHPEVRSFIIGLIREVVTRYDVDGIQLDDHFGMPVQFGYDAFTVALYRQEHQGKNPPSDCFNPDWMRWRANKMTDFMVEICSTIKALKPSAIISLSPNSQTFAYKYYLQDWTNWVKRDLIDELILQVYRTNPDSFAAELEKPSVKFARSRIPVSIGILAGTLKTPMKIAQIKQQVQTVRRRNFAGISFFYWESLWGDVIQEPAQKRFLGFEKLFAARAVRP